MKLKLVVVFALLSCAAGCAGGDGDAGAEDAGRGPDGGADGDADGDGDADTDGDGDTDGDADGDAGTDGGADGDTDADSDGDICWEDPPDDSISEPNPKARADAFALFYKERAGRVARSVNRFALAGDAIPANFFGGAAVSRSGDAWEVVPGPSDNNPFGMSLYATWKLYQSLGGRDLELTLIRMLEGIVFNEEVSGHPGLTTREALSGMTRVMDGVAGEVRHSRFGESVPPHVSFDASLEEEILSAFYEDVVFTYRENPEEVFFNFMPAHSTGSFAVTYVFDELDHDPPFLRQSDCCSSFMISQKGDWKGAIWGNHNSRDNFTDIALGFVTAMDIARMGPSCLPQDLRDAAQRAVEAAHRTGDNIVDAGNMLLTVDEWHDYDTLTVSGACNPDGEVEAQDLGSMNSCAMVYLAQAVSSDGLTTPVDAAPVPGDLGLDALKNLLVTLGIIPPGSAGSCSSIDDAIGGLTWKELVNAKFLGVSIWTYMKTAAPGVLESLTDSTLDDFAEMMIAPLGLASYARINGDEDLFDEAAGHLESLLGMSEIIADVALGQGDADKIARVEEMQYLGAVYARMLGLDSPLERLGGFARGEEHTAYLEAPLSWDDTSQSSLKSDAEILSEVEAHLVTTEARAPWRVERYRDRFGTTPPVRRAGDGYEAVQVDDSWGPVEIPRHDSLGLGNIDLWLEAALCRESPATLDCTWAALGCAAADVDGDGRVGDADEGIFDEKWETHGEGAACSGANDHCDGADLDKSGTLDDEDRAFLEAANGCSV